MPYYYYTSPYNYMYSNYINTYPSPRSCRNHWTDFSSPVNPGRHFAPVSSDYPLYLPNHHNQFNTSPHYAGYSTYNWSGYPTEFTAPMDFEIIPPPHVHSTSSSLLAVNTGNSGTGAAGWMGLIDSAQDENHSSQKSSEHVPVGEATTTSNQNNSSTSASSSDSRSSRSGWESIMQSGSTPVHTNRGSDSSWGRYSRISVGSAHEAASAPLQNVAGQLGWGMYSHIPADNAHETALTPVSGQSGWGAYQS